MTVPNEIEDALHVYNWVKADSRFGNIGIAGHSQGGVVTAMLAGQLGKKVLKGGVVLLAAHDRELLTSAGQRVLASQPDGSFLEKFGTYDDYLAWMAERKGGNAAE